MKAFQGFGSRPGEATDPDGGCPAAPARLTARRWIRTPKATLVAVLLLLATVTAPGAPGGAGRAWLILTAAALTAAAADTIFAAVRGWGLIWPDGGLLTGMIIGLVIDPTVPVAQVVAIATGAVLAKHLVRVRHRHLFNPAGLALVAAAPAGVDAQSWWGASSAPQPLVLPLLLVGGYCAAKRVNRQPMVAVFLAGYWALLVAAGFGGLTSQVADAFHAPLLNAVVFFALIMLDDPPTSPGRPGEQYTYGLLVAATSVVLLLATHQLVFLPAALLIGNAWLAVRRLRQRVRPPAPAPAARTAGSRLPGYGAIAAAALLLFVVWGNSAMAGMLATPEPTPGRSGAPSAPAGMTLPTTAPSTLSAGQTVTLIVRVDATQPANQLTAMLLQPDAAGRYAPTGRRVTIDHSAVTAITMGNTADLRAGAILQVTGIVRQAATGTTQIDATRIVNLTGVLPTTP